MGKNKNKKKTGNSEQPSEIKDKQTQQQPHHQTNQPNQVKQNIENFQDTTTTLGKLPSTKVQQPNEQLTKDETTTDNNESSVTYNNNNTTEQTVAQTPLQQQQQSALKMQQSSGEVKQPSVEQPKQVEKNSYQKSVQEEKQEKRQQRHQQILIEIPQSRQNLQNNKQEHEDIQINIETSANFQSLQHSQQPELQPIRAQSLVHQSLTIVNNQQKSIQEQVPQPKTQPLVQAQPTNTTYRQVPTSNPLQNAQVLQTQVVYVQELQPVSVEKPTAIQKETQDKQPLPEKQETKHKQQLPEKQESLLISQSDHSDFISKSQTQPQLNPHVQFVPRVQFVEPQPQVQFVQQLPQKFIDQLAHHSVESRVLSTSLDQVQSNNQLDHKEQPLGNNSVVGHKEQLQENNSLVQQKNQLKASAPTPIFNSVKTQSILIESQSLLIDSYPIDKRRPLQSNSPMQQIKKQLKNVQSIIIQSTTNQQPRQTLLASNQTTQTILLSEQQSQTTPVLTPSDIQQLRAKNQEQQVKRKKLKQQQQHERWTKFYEQKRKRQEQERKRHDEQMKRLKVQEQKKNLRQQKQQVEKEDYQLKKNLQKLKQIKKDVDDETPLAIKLGISLVASLTIGGLAWLGMHNQRVSAISAVASLAIAFIVQK